MDAATARQASQKPEGQVSGGIVLLNAKERDRTASHTLRDAFAANMAAPVREEGSKRVAEWADTLRDLEKARRFDASLDRPVARITGARAGLRHVKPFAWSPPRADLVTRHLRAALTHAPAASDGEVPAIRVNPVDVLNRADRWAR